MREATYLQLGFTGTRREVPVAQRLELTRLMDEFNFKYHGFVELHHGDCVGADELAHGIAMRHNWKIVIHPPVDPKYRAWCAGQSGGTPVPSNVTVLEPKPYLERNMDIALAATELLAAPERELEELRSGTWATVRYARNRFIRITLALSNGNVREERTLA